jgi:hypothetical protein
MLYVNHAGSEITTCSLYESSDCTGPYEAIAGYEWGDVQSKDFGF